MYFKPFLTCGAVPYPTDTSQVPVYSSSRYVEALAVGYIRNPEVYTRNPEVQSLRPRLLGRKVSGALGSSWLCAFIYRVWGFLNFWVCDSLPISRDIWNQTRRSSNFCHFVLFVVILDFILNFARASVENCHLRVDPWIKGSSLHATTLNLNKFNFEFRGCNWNRHLQWLPRTRVTVTVCGSFEFKYFQFAVYSGGATF